MTKALTGQTEKVHQPTALAGLIEQGLQVYSSVFERVLECWRDELEIHYRLNRKHLDPKEYFVVVDPTMGAQPEEIARADYADDLMIYPVADPKQVDKQAHMQQEQLVYQTLIQNPLVMADQTMVSLYNVTKRYLEAMEVENIDEVLVNPQELFENATELAGGPVHGDIQEEARAALPDESSVEGGEA